MDPFDPTSLALPAGSIPPIIPRRSPRHRPGEKFLKGPIPLAWIRVASQLPGKALAVGLNVWYIRGVQKRNAVHVNLSRLGMCRWMAQRGLKQLAAARLVSVEHRIGRRSLVTLLPAPVSDNAVSLDGEECDV